MKGKILAGFVLCALVIPSLGVTMNAATFTNSKKSSKSTLYQDKTANYSACKSQYGVTTTTDGGRLAYGCSDYLFDESYSTYSHSGATVYAGFVSSNGNSASGPWRYDGAKSEASVGFDSGSQIFGHYR